MNDLKKQYHSFSNGNRSAEVFLDTANGEKNWSVDCFENNDLSTTFELPYEAAAEQLAEEWVFNYIQVPT